MKLDEYLTGELAIRKTTIRNKILLGGFLFICIFALLLTIINGILLDLGYRQGKVHLNFWDAEKVKDWIPLDPNSKYYSSSVTALRHHPNTIWFLTQFTWLTTIIIIIFLVIRFFQISEVVPKWLRWVLAQRTLTLVTIYDFIVGTIFWTAMTHDFKSSFSPDLFVFEVLITVLVHAVIPLLTIIYSLSFLISSPKASLLRERFVLKGMIWPLAYMGFYILSTIIWDDPYSVTTMHNHLNHGGWSEWAIDLWKMPAMLVLIYAMIGVLTMIHNFVLLRFNKSYTKEKDYEEFERKERIIEKTRTKIQREFTREIKMTRRITDRKNKSTRASKIVRLINVKMVNLKKTKDNHKRKKRK